MNRDSEPAIFTIDNEKAFHDRAMEIFRFQASENNIYKDYLSGLKINPSRISTLTDIPFLPIEFFKTHKVYCGRSGPELVFESSGTSGMAASKHYVARSDLYEQSFRLAFEQFYGDPAEICLLALLPSYLQRENSSLVYMMQKLIQRSRHPESGFYLDDLASLSKVLENRIADKHKTILLGVSFALLDFAEKSPFYFSANIIIIETGGMKGRRKEMVRSELHQQLKKAFNVPTVHSEYGMTELLSQAYSTGAEKFMTPPWMKVFCRDMYDPLSAVETGQSGAINVIDLANIYSCSFIATSDLGRVLQSGQFEITGRFDQSDIRGCNLLVS